MTTEIAGIWNQPLQGLSPTGPAVVGRALSARPRQVSEEQAAKDFESVLIHKLLDEMKRTIPDSGLLSSGMSRQVQDLFWFHLAGELADGGGLGLYKQLQHSFGPGAGEPAAQMTELTK